MFNFNTDALNTVPLNALDGQLGLNAALIGIPFELTGVLQTNEIALEAIPGTLTGQLQAADYFTATGLTGELTGTIENGNVGTINLTAIPQTCLLYWGNEFNVTAIPATLTGNMLGGNVGNINLTGIPQTLSGYVQPNLYIDLNAIKPTVTGTILNSALMQGDIIAINSKLSGRILSGSVGTLELTEISQEAVITAIQEGLIEINLTAIPEIGRAHV